ncbi:MAG: FtsX-like permease family protein, partial [Akkermansia sp.]|nr:FtsX-like permease family protein [Akkermansia sp.]
FNHAELHSPGVVFMVSQAEYDAHYILTSLDFARQLFDQEGRVSAMEIRLREGEDVDRAKKEIRKVLGPSFLVHDRYEQQEDVFRIMRVEKLISYLFLTFILLVACFNIIGSLSMLMIDKKADVQTLRSLGADNSDICRIFMYEGRLISLLGAVVGIVLGLLLCWLQQTFGFISMGGQSGSFIVEAYPVSVHFVDILLNLATVVAVGWVSVWYPVRHLSRRLLNR